MILIIVCYLNNFILFLINVSNVLINVCKLNNYILFSVSVQNSPIQNISIQNGPEKYEKERKSSPIQNSPKNSPKK